MSLLCFSRPKLQQQQVGQPNEPSPMLSISSLVPCRGFLKHFPLRSYIYKPRSWPYKGQVPILCWRPIHQDCLPQRIAAYVRQRDIKCSVVGGRIFEELPSGCKISKFWAAIQAPPAGHISTVIPDVAEFGNLSQATA